MNRTTRFLAFVALLVATGAPVGAQVAPTSTTTSTTTTTTSVAAASTTTTTTPQSNYRKVIDLSFPTDRRVTYTNTYDAARAGGRVHKATDLMGQKGWKLYAAVAGTVCTLTGVDQPMPSYGYLLTVCGDDGRKYNYVHINNDTPGTDDGAGGPEFAYAPRILRGARVARGQWVAVLGDSGNSEGTSPHLHFEIEDPQVVDPYGTRMVNPYFSLQAARQRNDYPPDPGAPTFDATVRVAGSDRVATAIALSQATFERAAHVVIASSTSVADAMAAGPLAMSAGAPVLITPGAHLDARVATEVRRLGATAATVMGGAETVSDDVVGELATKAGVPRASIVRVGGTTRYATAAAAAFRLWRGASASSRRAVVALGAHADPARAWPDALTAGWLGAVTNAPVLLVTADGVPAETAAALDGVSEVVIVGGTAAVSATVADAVRTHAGVAPRRLSGADRYATSAAVAEYATTKGAQLSRVWAITGRSPADALAAGAAVARADQLLVLVDGLDGRTDAAMGRWLRARVDRIASARAIGGAKVITDAALGRLARRIT